MADGSPASIDLELHPKQGMALQTTATEILYGGAAGGGKSHLMRVTAILFCAMIPGFMCYIFRRVSADLIKNHLEGPKGFRAILAPWVTQGFCNIVENEIRFWNGSKIFLCHCEHEKDIYKYQGAEIHLLLIDEITHFTEVMYRFLRNRVRMVGVKVPADYKGMFPRILCGGNPGNIGHLWVKRTFIDGHVPMQIWTTPDEEGGMKRQFIPAQLDDNPSMTEDDPTYEKRLQGLGSEALVRAMRYGDWNVIEGAFFDCFQSNRHLVDPIALPKHWFRFRSFDWGSAKPFCCLWIAVSDGTLPQFPRGALVVYRELYGAKAPNVGLKLPVEDVAAQILTLERDDAYQEGGTLLRPNGVADPAIFAEDGGPSLAERMGKQGCTWKPADNKRVPGWDQIRFRLLGEDDTPMLYFFRTCVNLVRTLPALQHDKNKPEDVDTDSEDHAADALRYGCMARPYVRKLPTPEAPRFLHQATANELFWPAKAGRSPNRRI